MATNPFYNHTDGVPANQTRGVSALVRNEFDLIAAGFNLVAPLVNPIFQGVPQGPTASPGTNTAQLATTAFVIAQGLTSALPGQAGNAGRYITTNGSIASWSDLVGITQATSDNSTNVATTAYVVNRIAQDAPSKTGSGASGSWNITAAKATNLDGGANGQIAYQTGAGATGFLAVGSAGQILLSNGAAAPTWTSTIAVTAGGTGSSTAAGARTNLGAAASGSNGDITSLTGLTSAIYATGQCQLTLSAGSLKLLPFNGNMLIVNGRSCTVPDAGVTLAATGLSATTLYYIYATQSGGVINALEASTTAFAVSTTAGNKGVRIKNGDDTRTYVGAAYVKTAATYADSLMQRFVRSLFNEGPIVLKNFISGAGLNYASATPAELSVALRCEVLLLAGEALSTTLSGSCSTNNLGDVVYTGIGYDSTSSPETGVTTVSSYAANASLPVSCSAPITGLAVGYHYATVIGYRVGTGTASWTGSTSGQHCLTIEMKVNK